MMERASVRAYDLSRPVPQGLIEELLTAAMQAPTTGNMQLYSVIITRDAEGLKKMRQLHYGQPMAEQCGVLLTFCADVNRFGLWCRQRQAVSGLDNPAGMLMAMEDATIFAQQFVAAAESCGLGTCYLGTVPYNIKAFCRELKLPQGVMPLFSVSVGWPAAAPRQSDRLPLKAVVHSEEYKDYTPSDIDTYYGTKESLPENMHFVAENNKETLAQVYADIRYPQAQNEVISEDIRPYLKY